MEVDFSLYLSENKPYLEKVQVQEMINEGFTVGAHSMDHPEFDELNEEDILRQISGSIRAVEALFQPKHYVFSFPFTADKLTMSLLEKAHSRHSYSPQISFGTSGIKRDSFPWLFHRIPVENYNTSLGNVMKYQKTRYRLQRLLNKEIIHR